MYCLIDSCADQSHALPARRPLLTGERRVLPDVEVVPAKPLAFVLLGVGQVGLFVTYSNRPPPNFIDTFAIMAQGRKSYITSPKYEVFLTISGLIALCGVYLLMRPKRQTTSVQ